MKANVSLNAGTSEGDGSGAARLNLKKARGDSVASQGQSSLATPVA